MIEGGPARPRYAVFDEIGAGGMATVHLGRQLGAAGFAKTVAVKRLRPGHVRDAEFVAMFADEARLCARVRHPNVAQTLDVVGEGGELFLVLEYVHGESLDALSAGAISLGERVPADVASALLVGVLGGLQAAHVARSEAGEPLDIVHRDVSPQNVLVGVDGVARLIDFGIAKASVRLRSTRDGKLKGKLPYMAPEQLAGDEATALSDLYSAGVLLWELLAGRRLFDAPNEGALLAKVLEGRAPPLGPHAPELPAAVETLVAKALAREPVERFRSAHEMAVALELALPPASPRKVGEWVEHVAGRELARRAERIAQIERETAAAAAEFAAGEARVSFPPEGRPGATPQLTFSMPPAAAVRRMGPDGETVTMTAPRARVPRLSPPGEPSAPSAPALATTPQRRGRMRLGWALFATVLTLPAVLLAGRALVLPVLSGASARSLEGSGGEGLRPSERSGSEGARPSERHDVNAASQVRGGADVAPTAHDGQAPDVAATPLPTDDAAQPGARHASPHVRRTAAPSKASPPKPATPAPVADTPPPERPRCDPPYYLDASGIRRVKRECL